MPLISLSYRRIDSTAITGRVYDHLVTRYGEDKVFMDVSGIPYGADYREHIQGVFHDTKLVLAIVGPEWVGKNANGARIQEKLDPIRVEISTAMQLKLRILPMRIDSAKMPDADELPEDIREFAYRNAMPLDSGIDFPLHMERLVTYIDKTLGLKPIARPAPSDDGAVAPQGLLQTPAADTTTLGWASRLAPYFVAPVVLLLLAHYLIVMTWDVNPDYLRLLAVAIPAPAGLMLYRQLQLGVGAAAALGLGIALVAVIGMMAVVGLIDGHSILPSSKADWQEAFEYFGTIALATAAGNLLGRVAYATVPRRSAS
jgi:hypothetical protein